MKVQIEEKHGKIGRGAIEAVIDSNNRSYSDCTVFGPDTVRKALDGMRLGTNLPDIKLETLSKLAELTTKVPDNCTLENGSTYGLKGKSRVLLIVR